MQAQAIPVQGKLKVGDWTVEPDLNQLSRPGKAVKIEPKAMSLLLHLANRPGEVVSREALLSEIWPSAVVGDDSLTQAIIKLRKALGDDPDKPTYIQTVTKRGIAWSPRLCGRRRRPLRQKRNTGGALSGSRAQPLQHC